MSRPEHDFNESYVATPPWDIGHPQPAFLGLAEARALSGHVLDVGCGTGEHALMAASRGHRALGIDFASRAIDRAREKAAQRGLLARFELWNALDLGGLHETFDTVLDCGLFHVFDDGERQRFVESLRDVVPAGGRYFMLCFSDRQPGDWGPRRVAREEIEAAFAEGWRLDALEPTVLEITMDLDGAQAWLASLTRLG